MLASFCCAGYPSVPFFRLQMQLFILNSGWKSGAHKNLSAGYFSLKSVLLKLYKERDGSLKVLPINSRCKFVLLEYDSGMLVTQAVRQGRNIFWPPVTDF